MTEDAGACSDRESAEEAKPNRPVSTSARPSRGRPLLWRAQSGSKSPMQRAQEHGGRVPTLAQAFIEPGSLTASPNLQNADLPPSAHQTEDFKQSKMQEHPLRRVLPTIAVLGMVILVVGATGLTWLLSGSGRKGDLTGVRNAALASALPALSGAVARLPQTPISLEVVNLLQTPLLSASGTSSPAPSVTVPGERTVAPPTATTTAPEPTATASPEPLRAVATEGDPRAVATVTAEPTREPAPVGAEPLAPSGQTGGTGKLEVIESRYYFDQDGNLHLAGSVRNSTQGPQGGVVVRAVLYDQGGRAVAQGWSELNTDLVEPGSVGTFDITIGEPPPFSSYYFWLEATRLP